MIIKKTVVVLLLATGLIIPLNVFAEKTITYDYIMQMEYMYYQGMISAVSPMKDYYTVSDKKIYLVDVKEGQEYYKTFVGNSDGSETNASQLTVGKRIFVWGGVMRAGGIAAKDILILDKQLSEKEIEKLPMIEKHDIWGGKRKRYE